MKMLQNKIAYVAFILFTILATTAMQGCTTSGNLGPYDKLSFNDDLAIAYTTVTAVRQTTTTILRAKKIHSDDGQNVLNQTEMALEGLHVAERLSAVDMKTASGKLTAVKAVLSALSSYVADKQ